MNVQQLYDEFKTQKPFFTAFHIVLECGHSLKWGECDSDPTDPNSDLPYAGRLIYCDQCEQDREISEVFPQTVVVALIPLSTAPRTPSHPGEGWVDGERLIVEWDSAEGSYCYFFEVFRNGHAFDGEVVCGFATPVEAIEAALASGQE